MPIVYPLGAVIVPDPRDRDFPMAAVLAAEPAPEELPTRVLWEPVVVLDQRVGEVPFMCVGYTAEMWLRSAPVETTDGPDAALIFRAAKERDDVPGEDTSGTTVRGALKFLQEDQRVGEYRWAENVDDVVSWLRTMGTVLAATPWYERMDTPEDGVLHVGGEKRGHHAYLLYGVDIVAGVLYMANPWGLEWGDQGTALFEIAEFAKLLPEGEAVGVVELPRLLPGP